MKRATWYPARRWKVLEAIERYWRENGYGPSYRDIMYASGYNSTSSTQHAVRALQREGKVIIGPDSRSIRLAGKPCPMCGRSA